ncbi:hypothetical protein pb186bvf_009994 [Paramecium bursaria]
MVNILQYLESWGFNNFKLFIDPQDNCIQIFDQSNYGGTQQDLCSQESSLIESRSSSQIRSLKLNSNIQNKRLILIKRQVIQRKRLQYFLISSSFQLMKWKKIGQKLQIEQINVFLLLKFLFSLKFMNFLRKNKYFTKIFELIGIISKHHFQTQNISNLYVFIILERIYSFQLLMQISQYVFLLMIIGVFSAPTLVSQSFVGNDFNNIDGWNVLGAKPGFNVCSGNKIFGGYGFFAKGAIANKLFQLPPHSIVYLKVQFWKISTWDNEEFHIWVDDQHVFKKAYSVQQGKPRCGRENQFEEIVDIDLKIKHTGASAFVLFTSTLDEAPDNESWGIRDFSLSIEKCPDGCDACVEGDTTDKCNFWKVSQKFFTFTQLDGKQSNEGWQVTGQRAEATNCGGVPLFGGFDIFGKGAEMKITLDLKPHYQIKAKFVFMKIDSWDNEVAFFRIDNNEVWKRAFQYNEGYFQSLCGQINDWRELLTQIEINAVHTADKALFHITTNLDEAANNESWGIRDFYVFIAKCADNCAQCTGPKGSDCKKCAQDFVNQGGECRPLPNFVLLEQSFLDAKFNGINDWILKNNKAGRVISECGGKNLVGGFDILGKGASAEKKFNIPAHKKIKLSITLYKLDSWDDEWMYIRIDGVEVWKQQWNLQLGGANICGQGVWNDAIIPVELIQVHTAPTALVFLTSNLDEDPENESWGFRDFRLFYEPNEECAIFYTECDFKGQAFDFCDRSPNFPNDKVPSTIRSIKIPPQGKVTLYESSDYKGKKIVYTEDQRCIKSFDYSFLQLSGHLQKEWIEAKPLASNIRG